jgi:hypothetical protein
VVETTNLVELVVEKARSKQAKELAKASSTKAKGSGNPPLSLAIPKLDDANFAGSAGKKGDCTLILTEGDSAKALALAGLSALGQRGRDYYGVFPLKVLARHLPLPRTSRFLPTFQQGKLLNVRDASHEKIIHNLEINNLIKILGLQHNTSYLEKKVFVSSLSHHHLCHRRHHHYHRHHPYVAPTEFPKLALRPGDADDRSGPRWHSHHWVIHQPSAPLLARAAFPKRLSPAVPNGHCPRDQQTQL